MADESSSIGNEEHCHYSAMGTSDSCRTSCLLQQPDDHLFLSSVICFLRQHIEAFVSTNDNGDGKIRPDGAQAGYSKHLGLVGVRCRHCAEGHGERRAKSGVFYPRSIRLVYQAVRNIRRYHILACDAMPDEAKKKYNALISEGRSRSSNDAPKYWEECCRRMGMVDAEDGIRLRTGNFVVQDGITASVVGNGTVAESSSASAAMAGAGRHSEPVGVLPFDKGSNEASNNRNGPSDEAVEEKSSAGNEAIVASGGIKDPPTSCLLQQPSDHLYLNDLFCFTRQHVEAFVTKKNDANGRGNADSGKAEVVEDAGRVGLRCIYCAQQHVLPRTKGAISFPQSTRLVYQAMRNFQRYHILACPSMPKEVKEKFIALKSAKRMNSSRDASAYWEECCRRMGMVDTGEGIRLRTGYFEDASCGGEFSFDKSAARRSMSSMKGTVTAKAKPVEADFTCTDTKLTETVPGAGVDAEAGASSPPARSFLSNEEENRSICDQAMKQSLGKRTAAITQRGTEIDKESSSSESNSVAAEAIDLFFDNSETPSQPNICSSALERAFDDPFEGINDKGTLSDQLTNPAVLEKVHRALRVTEAVRRIRLLPAMKSPTEEDEVNVLHSNEPEHQLNDLHFLGLELYEMFSGMNPFEVDENSDATPDCLPIKGMEQEDGDSQEQRKKEKRPELAGYLPLRDLGFPAVICSLVSSLLDREVRSDHHSIYESVGDVEEDLRLMASKPERFLFQSPSWDLEVAPGALYGREEETSKLLEAYSRAIDPASTLKEMVLVSGYSGTGKSSLIRSVRGRFVKRGACFISGKFDEMQQLQPLTAIMMAMDEYCDLLAGNIDRIHEVQKAVKLALGDEGVVVLTSLIPNFYKVVSPTDAGEETPRIDGKEALQQFIFMIQMFFRVTCSRASPVVLFLDDLQWSDEISLMLMHALVADTAIEGLLFIGCYRDNEVGADDPIMSHLADIRSSGHASVTSISIGNLSVRSINSLISDTLILTPRMTQSLAETVLHKTRGNALFVMQFLFSLRDEGLLHFSLSSKQWEWDVCKIRQKKQIADNVADFLAAKLQKMAPEVLEVLKTLAAFGAQCQEDILHILNRAPDWLGSTATALVSAVAEGVLDKIGSAYRFAHDQIQHAAYLLIPESERPAFHLLIGRLLWKWCTDYEAESYLFVTIDQLHRGSSLIVDHCEKIALARLSLMAAKKAVSKSAFLPALAYLRAGIGMLNDQDWYFHRELCFELLNNCGEAEYILGDFVAMQGHLDEVLKRGRTLQERLRAHFTLVRSMGAQGRVSDAVSTTLAILPELGETLPAVATEAIVKEEIALTATLLSKETERSILQKETMEDTEKREAMKFLHALLYYVFNVNRSYLPVPVCRMVRLSILYGVCSESAYVFGCYGMILSGVLGNHAEGYRFGKIALQLLARFNDNRHLPNVYAVVYGILNHLSEEPIQSCLTPLKDAVSVGLATGDTEHAMLCAYGYASIALSVGQPLGPLVEEMRTQSRLMLEYKQIFTHNMGKPFRQTILNLLDLSEDPTKLVGDEMDEDSLRSSLEKSDHVAFLIHSYRLWLEYLFGKYHDGWESRKMSSKDVRLKDVVVLFPAVCTNAFYGCLTALALAREEENAEYIETIDETMTQMEMWAASAPWNCRNKLELMKAEFAFFKGDFAFAAACYDLAIDFSAKCHFIHEQALALERFGIFHLTLGDLARASSLFERASECYNRWGAISKVAHVRDTYL